ncbi:NAD(P)-binding protein [Microstroma glucosiphilum]|uniref:NAD(P)-binding protein n=1 Tax=Pseudomicrostroma glucosiphilum TaxID=1684307 RepID=A0A316U000_9BASI|nr:NAD(P)-binding protein [Pseudomicrostroma glucosiphilum]PWN18742.1 NAD(P)-binding protein [Pseudomicrostroma glucosiphilum]
MSSSSSQVETVLITGAGGFLGSLLPTALVQHEPDTRFNFILTDTFEPKTPSFSSPSSSSSFSSSAEHKVHTLSSDLTEPKQVQGLFNTPLGKPDTIYSLHGIMSLGSEKDFDLGVRVNFDSTRELLNCARRIKEDSGEPVKFVFTSSVATYGGALPDVILPTTACTPEGAYGMAKLMCEYMVTEYSRRGFIDGRSIKLPTIVVRPGPPSAATSSFVSAIIREPLSGNSTPCPIGKSLDDPLLSQTGIWIASPSTTLQNFVLARRIPSSRFPSHSRTVQLPGFKVTVKEILEALGEVLQGGEEEVKRMVQFEDDETCRRIVASWPSEFDVSWAVEELGFKPDSGGIRGVIQEFIESQKSKAG